MKQQITLNRKVFKIKKAKVENVNPHSKIRKVSAMRSSRTCRALMATQLVTLFYGLIKNVWQLVNRILQGIIWQKLSAYFCIL